MAEQTTEQLLTIQEWKNHGTTWTRNKAFDKNGDKLFQDGDKASLRREVEANILQEIQLAMINAGQDREVSEAKADLKS